MILKQERDIPEIKRGAPNVGEPYKGVEQNKPHKFYEYNKELSSCIAGYQEGFDNPYVEYLMNLDEELASDKKKVLTK